MAYIKSWISSTLKFTSTEVLHPCKDIICDSNFVVLLVLGNTLDLHVLHLMKSQLQRCSWIRDCLWVNIWWELINSFRKSLFLLQCSGNRVSVWALILIIRKTEKESNPWHFLGTFEWSKGIAEIMASLCHANHVN